jgi:hypothetical protein
MLTTAGAFVFAMFRKVVASMGPLSGALLVGGTETVCADEAGVRSSREVMTTVTAMVASAIRTT